MNFAIVGAPKCGTTSLFQSLSERKDISFLGKDSHLLGQDLDLLLRDSSLNYQNIITQFKTGVLIGDVSVWYLYSKSAAQEILELNPKSKIIICLRNPLELIPSLHNQHFKGGDEPEHDLNKALSADFNNEDIAKGVHFGHRPRYIDSVNFPLQIQRYTERFKDILFVFYEDLQMLLGDFCFILHLFLSF